MIRRLSFLERVTAFVDRDVASNGKPLSLIGMIVPFVPFILFVDGAPADRFPFWGAVALTLSLGWGVFVLWRLMRWARIEMRPYRARLGPVGFWSTIIGTVVAIVGIAMVIEWVKQG